MSNLGLYQDLTMLAKKVGGPKNLIGLLAGGSFAAGILATKGGEAIIKKKKDANNKDAISHFYRVNKTTTDQDGLTLKEGDTFRVLEEDDDAILIEITGDTNNPYFVSSKWLETVSDFKKYNCFTCKLVSFLKYEGMIGLDQINFYDYD